MQHSIVLTREVMASSIPHLSGRKIIRRLPDLEFTVMRKKKIMKSEM